MLIIFLLNKFMANFILRYCKDIVNLLFLGILGMLDHPYQKSQYQFVWNFHAHLHAENQLHHSLLLKLLQKIANLLFWVI